MVFSGNNLQAFLIGRQICVTICMFVVARITAVNVDVDAGENIFGVSHGVQTFFNTGLLGALIATVVASLAWRIIASSFPVPFLSNPLIYLIVRLCLLLEASGVCSAAWLLALMQKVVANYQFDEVYIGTAEERAAISQEAYDVEQAEGAMSA
jgi:Silicon transporter